MPNKQASPRSDSLSSNPSPSLDSKPVSTESSADSREDAEKELERLREILYGHQARLWNKRLDDLEARLEQLHTEMQRRDEEIRRELVRSIDALEKDKASRHDVARMLIELGQRLANSMRPSEPQP